MNDDTPCCAASRADDATQVREPMPETGAAATDTGGMVKLDGGTFTMGTDDDVGFAQDGEGPTHEVFVDSFYVDECAVTNAEFFQFVRDTDYSTDAERYGWSFVFRDFVDDADRDSVLSNVDAAPWWLAVEGASWLRPYGPSTNVLEDRELLHHPVTHISWSDARAYAKWAGKRLPTEAEWEYAARGGLEGKRFPWGNDLHPDGEHRCNIWQGDFPAHNTADDGYRATAPVNAFEPNDFGLYNVAGNVWEWCADWFSGDYYTTGAYTADNPAGPDDGVSRVMRGGSYLCHHSWCNRYRVAARSKNTPESSTGNIGFRCVVDT